MKSFRPDPDLHVYVELHNSEEYKDLESRYSLMCDKVKSLEKEINRLVLKYGTEVHLNAELIDILRSHGIPFRPSLENTGDRYE